MATSSASPNLSVRVGLTGDDQVRAQLAALGQEGTRQFGGLADASDAATTRMSSALSRWTNSVDPVTRAQGQLAKGQTVFNDALSQGLITGDRHQQLMGLLAQRYGTATAATNAIGAATEGAGHASGTAARELRALFDELSSGRIYQTPSTLAIIATRVLGISLASIGTGIAIGAIPFAFVLAAFQANKSLDQINKALAGTGNQIGQTTGQIVALARAASSAGQVTYSNATAIAAEAIRAGASSPAELEKIFALTKQWADYTGKNAVAAAEDLAKALDDPAKTALEFDRQLNILTEDERRQIQQMQESGNTQGAALEFYDKLNTRLHTMGDNLGYIQRGWNATRDFFSNAWSAIGSIGVTPPPEQQLPSLLAQQAQLQGLIAAGNETPVARAMLNGITSQIDMLTAAVKKNQEQAKNDQTSAADRLLGKNASDAARQIDSVSTKIEDLTAKRDLLDKAIAGGVTTGNSQADLDREIAARQKLDLLIQAADPANAAARQVQALHEEAAAYSVDAAQRARVLEQLRIEQEYRNNAADATKAGSAAALRDAQAADAAAKRAATFRDPFGATGALGNAQFQNEQLGRIAAAGPAPADIAAVKAYNDALATTRELRAQANTPAEAAAVERLTNGLRDANLQRSQENALVQANDEDRKLQQTLAEKQLELSLMRQTPELRAQEIADLQTRNQLINEGLQENTAAFDSEIAKRKQINEAIAQTDVGIQRIQKDQQNAKQAAQEFGSFVGSSLTQLANGTETWHQKLTNIGQDFGNLLEKLFIIKPLEEEITALSGKMTGTGASGGGLFGNLFSGLFSGGGGSGTGALAASASSSSFDNMTFATGGVFDRGERLWGGAKLHRFAAGSVFTSPTFFGMAGGDVGQLGEAGPEGILPLSRVNGKLGVAAQGAGGTQHNYYIDASGAAPGVEEKIAAVIKMIQGVSASVERRAIAANVKARAMAPALYAPRYGR